MNFLKKWWIFLLSIGVWISWLTYVKCIGDWGELDGTGFDLGKLGDSFGVINSLISAFTIVLVYKTFGLQKDELEKTTKTLEGQEKAMNDQRVEQMIMNLLELSKNHLNDFRNVLEEKKGQSLNLQKDSITSYIERIRMQEDMQFKVSEDIKKGILDSAIYYFRTLKYIEDQVILEYSDNPKKLEKYKGLLETQITENLCTLHGLLFSSKDGIDKEMITFKYLFSNREIEPDIPKEKPKLGIIGSKF